jgi:hypothetical protein
MKQFFALALVVLFTGAAFADTPPQPGSRVSAVVDGTTAKILSDSLTSNKTGPLSEEAVQVSSKGQMKGCKAPTEGTVQVTKKQNSEVTVTCAEYYCMGHKAVCSLEEQF